MYRLFIDMSQVEMSESIGIKLSSYRAKEQGRVSFSDIEKREFKKIVSKYIPEVTIDDIFFTQ